MAHTALIVGAGSGISASFARLLVNEGYRVALASRTPGSLAALAAETSAAVIECDVAAARSVQAAFERFDTLYGAPDVVLFNPSYRTRGPLVELDPVEVERALRVTAFGGFLVAQQAARRMLPRGHGAILLTGASASVKGYALSAPFAMGKFALRGLAQSMARELHPQGIHVAHFVIDGGVRNAERGRTDPQDAPDSYLDPDAIAQTYYAILKQPHSAWSWEVELRPWVERF